MNRINLIQFSSVAQSCPTLCNSMDCNTPGLPVHHQLSESVQTQVLWVSDAIQPSHPSSVFPFSSRLQSFPASGSYSDVSILRIRWPKYWSFSFSISPSNEYSGLISFSMDWLDLLAIQGTLKSLLQHHSSKASILQHSPFFKGNQSWIFIGRTDAEAEAPLFWPPDVKNWLIGRDPGAGKDWRQVEKGTTEDGWDGWMASLTQWTWVWASSRS